MDAMTAYACETAVKEGFAQQGDIVVITAGTPSGSPAAPTCSRSCPSKPGEECANDSHRQVNTRQILDSRGNPTVEVDVVLEDGSLGRAAVPSGASTGAHEAVELRDGDRSKYLGKGVPKAVRGRQRRNPPGARRPGRQGPGRHRRSHDPARRHLQQGSARRQRHPRRVARGGQSSGRSRGLPLYRYVGGVQARLLPVPMMNIINGSAHADNPIDFQEFIIMPVGAPSLSEAVRMGAEVFHTLKKALKDAGHNTNVGDEGGFAPNLPSAEAALDFVVRAIEDRRLQGRPGHDAGDGLCGHRVLQGRPLSL